MKKIISLICIFLIFFNLTSCSNKEETKHIHNYSTDWKFDESYHFHECLNRDGKCDVKKIDINNHNFDEPVVEPNYASDGSIIYKYTCKECGYNKKEYVKHNHNYDILKNDDTYHWYECSSKDGLCSDLVVNKNFHDFDDGIVDSNDKLLTIFTCKTCNYQKQVYKGHTHNYSTDWKYDETYHFHECLNKDGICNLEFKDLTEHIFDNGVVTQTPTPTLDGTKEYKCKECGYIKYESISYFDENTDYNSIVSDVVDENQWNKAFDFNNVTIKRKIDYMNPSKITESYDDIIKINPDKLFYNIPNKWNTYYIEKYTFLDNNKNIKTLVDRRTLNTILSTDPAYNLALQTINKEVNIFKHYFENKYKNFTYDIKLNAYVSTDEINGFKDITVKVCNNKVVYLSCKKYSSKFNYNLYTYNFYDYGKTKMNFYMIDSYDNHVHKFEKFTNNKYCGDIYHCILCSDLLYKEHELKLVNETVSDINNPKKLTYKCNNCNFVKEKIEDHIYKQDDDFSAIVGDNKERFKFNHYNYTYSIFNDKALMATVKKDHNIISITENGVEQKFIFLIDSFGDNTDEAVLVENNTQKIVNIKDYPILNKYDITPIFDKIDRNYNFKYDPFEKSSKLELSSSKSIYFKIKNNFIPTIKIVEKIYQFQLIYNIHLYDNGTTKIDVPPVHYDHTYSDYIYDNHEYSYRKCINTNGICLLKNDIHIHSYSNTIIEPTFEKDGEIIHKCNNGNCNYQYSEPIKRILRENDDFINMKSEKEFKQHNYKSYKYKIEDVLKNEVHHISFEEIEDQINHITTKKWVLDNKEVIEITQNNGQILIYYTDGVTEVRFDYENSSVEYQQIRERVNSIAIELNRLDFNRDYFLRYDSFDECFVPDSNLIFTLPLYGPIFPGDSYYVSAKVYDGTVAYAELENYKNNEMINHYRFYCYEVIYDYK